MGLLPLGALAATAAAAFGVLLAYGAAQLGKALDAMFGNLPWPLSSIAGKVVGVVPAAINAIAGWLTSSSSAAAPPVVMPARATHQTVDAAIDTMTAVTRKLQELRANLGTAQGNLQHNIDVVYQELVQDLVTAATNLQHNMTAGDQALAARLVTVAQDLQHNIDVVYQELVQDLVTAATNLQHNMTAGDQAVAKQAAGDATAAYTAAVGDVNTTAADVANPAWAALSGPTAGLRGQVGTMFPGTLAGVPAITAAPPADLAGVLSGVLAAVAPLTVLADECSSGMCRDLGGLRQGLNGLSGLFTDGALLAFLAAAVADPAGVADTVVSDFGGAISDVVAGLSGALGV